jgi:hypothetical protein
MFGRIPLLSQLVEDCWPCDYYWQRRIDRLGKVGGANGARVDGSLVRNAKEVPTPGTSPTGGKKGAFSTLAPFWC